MDLTVLQVKLMRAARGDAPPDAVPFSFEKRVMAHIRARPPVDQWTAWAQALWRAAAPCAAIALMLGAWTFFEPETASAPDEFVQHFESTVLAGAAPDSGLE